MAGMRELKKRLRSINTTSQLAVAMKTVSSAKFSRINKIYTSFTEYAAASEEISSHLSSAMPYILPCENPSAPECLVIITSNRGLCGGYNSSLLDFATKYFEQMRKNGREYKIIVCGKIASAYFKEHNIKIEREFALPDVPTYNGCTELYEYLRGGYVGGKFSKVTFIYQHFVNTLRQIPSTKTVMPLENNVPNGNSPDGDILCLPDCDTVMRSMCHSCVDTSIYMTVLEAATGAQAATLMAMREASDNARESIAALELEISRKRQSEVTSGVIETYMPEE